MDKKELILGLEKALPKMSKEEQARVSVFLEQYRFELAKEDFYAYLKLIAPEIIPEFKDGRHIRLYCNELEAAYRAVKDGKKYKLQFHLPPGGMKTLTCCIFVSWIFGLEPNWYVLHIGHTSTFAENTFGQRIKDIINIPLYRTLFPDTKISKHTRAKGEWKTTKGGVYHATGAGNAIAGKRAHIAICDDVLSEQTAISKAERTRVNEWYIPGLRSRLLPNSAEIVVNTRWHLDDLSGFIIKTDMAAELLPWRTVAIPAILEGPLGEAASELLELPIGSSYWPEFWPLEVFEDTKKSATPQVWNSLYMQNPVPADGAIFKRSHFQLWDEFENKGLPDPEVMILSVDTAFSKDKRADYSAWGLWGVFLNTNRNKNDKETVQKVFLYHAAKARLTYPELIEKIKELWDEHNIKYIVIEKKASGQSLIQDLALQGYPVFPYDPGRDDKETRANLCTPFLDAGLIYVPKHSLWAKDFLNECLEFPSGAHDDQVDQFTQAMLWMRDNMLLSHKGRATIDNDEDDGFYKPPKQSYWSAVARRDR